MQEETSTLVIQNLSVREKLSMSTDSKELFENTLVQLVEEAESSEEARDILTKFSPQAGVCGGRIHSSWGCLDCQADPTCVVCGDCFDESKHKGHRYHFKPYSTGCCDCGDPDAWDPKGFCDRHSGPSIDQLDLQALFAEIPSTLKQAEGIVKAIAWNIKTKSQALLLYNQPKLFGPLIKNLSAILDFSIEFIQLNAAFKKLLSDALADPLCGYSSGQLTIQIEESLYMPNHSCNQFVSELLNPQGSNISKETVNKEQKQNPIQTEIESTQKESNKKICLCTPLDVLLSSIESLNTSTGKQIAKLFYLMMGSYRFKCHFAYAYITNLNKFYSLKSPAAQQLFNLQVQFLTVPQIAATLITHPQLYFRLSMIVNKFFNSISDCVTEQEDQVPPFHIFLTLIYIFQSLPSNDVLLKKETPFLQMLTLSLVKVDQLDPKQKVTSHVDFDTSCVTGLQISHIATLWTRVLSIYELIDPLNNELIGTVMRALIVNLKRKPAKKHDFEQNGFYWFTFSHRLLFFLLRNWLLYHYLVESKQSDSSSEEFKENQLPTKPISSQNEENYLKFSVLQLITLLELENQSQLDALLEDIVYSAVKCLSFIHQIKSKKWVLLGLQVQSIPKLYSDFFQFAHFDIGTVQLALLLHSRPSQLIHKLSHSYYALEQASWSKSFLFLVKINLYDEQLVEEVKNSRNMDNLNEFMLFLLTVCLNPEPLYVHLFQEPTLPPLRKQSFNRLKERAKFIEQELTIQRVIKALFLAESSLSLPKLMKKIKNVSQGPMLKQAISELTSRYSASSGEVKFRLAPDQAVKVDCFRFMDTSDILQAESKGIQFDKYSMLPSQFSKPLQLPFMRAIICRAANSELLEVFSSIIRYTSEPALISPFVHKVAIRGLYQILSQQQPIVLYEDFKRKFLGQRLRGLLELQDTLPQDRILYKRLLSTGFDDQVPKGESTSQEKKVKIKQDKKKKKTQKLKEMMIQQMKKQQNAFLSNAQVSEELKELISTPVETERSGTQSESSLPLAQQPSLEMSSTSSEKGEEQRCCVCHQLLTLEDFKNHHPWGTPLYRGTSSIPRIAYAHALIEKANESDQEDSKEKGGLITDSVLSKINSTVKQTPYRHFHACPHFVHFKCFNDLKLLNMGSYNLFNSPIQKYACFQNEWLCPLCRQLANTLLPPVFGCPQIIASFLKETPPASTHTFKTDYGSLNVVKEFYERALYDNPLPCFVEELNSALFRVNLLSQVSYFFSTQRVALRAHLESILVMKCELKNNENPHLSRMSSYKMKIAEYFNSGGDFAMEDKLGILANLLNQICISGHIDANKLIEVWLTKTAENLVLLNYSRRVEDLQDCQEYLARSLCEVVCVLSIFAPEIIPEQNLQQMSSPLFTLQPFALMDYLSEILHSSSLQLQKDFALKYETALSTFKSIEKPNDLYEHVKFKQSLLTLEVQPELSFKANLPEVMQSFQLKYLRQACSFCHKSDTIRAYCLLCRKVFCMGSSHRDCEGCVGQPVGPLTLHSNQCNEGKGAFISLSKADILIFDGRKVAPLRSFYLDEFGNSSVELDKFPEHQADIRLREERVAQVSKLLALDKGALETASVIVKAKTVFRRGVL